MKRRVSPKMYISRFKTQLKNGLEISINSNKKTTVQNIPIGILLRVTVHKMLRIVWNYADKSACVENPNSNKQKNKSRPKKLFLMSK